MESVTISTVNTVMPRHIAAILDNLLAMILGVVAAKFVGDDRHALQIVSFVIAYLGYYFLFEALLSRTIGKFLTGLIIVRQDGSRISIRDVTIRTLFRILEVNPVLLGAIPAALSIIFSKHHQRIGDRFARTIVVPPRRLPKRQP